VTPAEIQLALALLNGLTSFFQNRNRTDIPAEMQQALDQAHAELTRIGAGQPPPTT